MKTLLKVAFAVFFSFSVLFTTVGYAAITGQMTVQGAATGAPAVGLYITVSEHDTTKNSARYDNHYHITHSTTFVSDIYKTSRNSEGSVVYEITVRNNTPFTYTYSGIEYQNSSSSDQNNDYSNFKGNTSIGTGTRKLAVTTSINTSTVVLPGESLTFTTTYTLGRYLAVGSYETCVKYKFVANAKDIGDYYSDAVFVQFESILNDMSAGGGYQTLIDAIDDKFDGYNTWTSNYIGNVDNTTEQGKKDWAVIEQLFEGKLQITLGGETVDVTLLIKREDVDNNQQTGDTYTAVNKDNGRSITVRGCEMTIMVTTDPLTSNGAYVPVYAAVFTCNPVNGVPTEWYQLGERYYGQAQANSYNGNSGSGSFNTETWVSRDTTYSPSDSYSYRISAGQTIYTITRATDNNATRELQSLLNQAKDRIDRGAASEALIAAFNDASRYYTVSESDGSVTLKTGLTRSQVVPHISVLAHYLS